MKSFFCDVLILSQALIGIFIEDSSFPPPDIFFLTFLRLKIFQPDPSVTVSTLFGLQSRFWDEALGV